MSVSRFIDKKYRDRQRARDRQYRIDHQNRRRRSRYSRRRWWTLPEFTALFVVMGLALLFMWLGKH